MKYTFFFLILLLSCNVSFLVDQKKVVKKLKGIIILVGNNDGSYHDIFIAKDKTSSDFLNSFFDSNKPIEGEEVVINIEKRKELVHYFCEAFENDIVTSFFYPENLTFHATWVEIEYLRQPEIKNLPSELNYEIEVHFKVGDRERIVEIKETGRMRILKIEPLISAEEYYKLSRKIINDKKEIEEKLRPCYEEILNEN